MLSHAGASPAAQSIRPSHEGREGDSETPHTVEAAIRLAHGILTAAGVALSSSKVTRLSRDYMTARPPVSFRAYVVRNARGNVASLPLPVARHGVEWLDPTGDTAVRNVMGGGRG